LRKGTTVHDPLADRQAAHELEPEDLDARLRWARERGHPLYLWQNVSPDEWRAALREIERVTSAVLRGETAAGLDAETGAGERALGIAAFTSGMGPLLGRWIEDGMLRAGAGASALFALHLEHGRDRAERMRYALRTAVAVLDAAGIAATLLKGAHTAYAYFPEPGVRPMSDLDLLVAARDRARAEAALAAAGHVLVPGSRLARPYRSDWRPPDSPVSVRSLELHHRDDPYTVDLHDSLELNFFGVRRVRYGTPDEGRRVPARWAGAHATVLAQPLLTAYQAAHASQGLHNLTLIRIVELALLLRPVQGRAFAWNSLAATIRGAGAERFVWPAFELVERLAPGTVDDAFHDRLTRAAPPRLRAVVAGLTPGTAQRLERVALDERFMWAATPIERVRRAADMLLPAGGSFHRLRRIYLDRALRLLRGRVTLRG